MAFSLDELQAAIARYDLALKPLGATAQLTPLEVLAVLSARDDVQCGLDQAHQRLINMPIDWLQQVITLDEQLRLSSHRIATAVDLDQIRASISPPESFWWWWFEPPLDPRDCLDWLWNGLTIACLTACSALVVEIGSKFLSVTPGVWESLAALAPAVATLTAGGGVLTQAGQTVLNRGFDRLRIPPHYRQEIKFALTAILLVGLIAVHLTLPAMARLYNSQGETALATGDLTTAETKLQRSLSLKPDYPESHFLLGRLYQQLDEVDKAETSYQYAAQAGYVPALAGLSRTAIATGDYTEASLYARQGLSQITPELLANPQIPADLDYQLYVNLGWAKFAQDQPDAAIAALDQAIAREPEQAIAHCIVAAVLADQGQSAAAQRQSRLCVDLAEPTEMNQWIDAARDRLDTPP